MDAGRYEMLARAAMIVGLVALALLPVGALGTKFGLWGFMRGFQFMFTGTFVASAVLVLGIALLVFALRAGRSQDALPIGIGLAASVLAVALMGWQFLQARSAPMLHHVSTDRSDPPVFLAVVELRGAGTNPLEYTAEIAAVQEAGYPDLVTERSALPPSESFAKALATARAMGWEIVREDAEAGMVEATATTFWFGFKDDVAIRVRAADGGSEVDLRSVSRVGLTDLGANAARIRAFLDRFRE